MGRWTVVDGDQQLVIETTNGGQISINIAIPPFVTDVHGVRDVRTKLGLAAGDVQHDSREPS